MSDLFDTRYIRDGMLSFVDTMLHEDIASGDRTSAWGAVGDQSARAIQFFTLLVVCHSVLVKNNDGVLEYKAASPDEAALVGAARDVRFTFLERVGNRVVLDVLGKRQEFTMLDSLEFTSDRKRMSVLVEMDGSDGDVLLLCKGADSIIYSRLAEDQDSAVYHDTLAHLEMFANDGLRTLVLAYRLIPRKEYNQWKRELAEAQTALTDRDALVEAVASRIEDQLVLMGATAIEDRLQDGVPESIALLSKAGIKIWVLTVC
jgi:phospholipid-translocating ATPase